MKLALIGADEESLELVQWAVAGGHRLVSTFDCGSHGQALRAIEPTATHGGDWESLVLGSAVDLVIVGRGEAGLVGQTGISDDERRADQLRKLAQAAVPLLVFVPACEAIVGYEIEMIRRDSGGHIEPYFPGRENLERLIPVGELPLSSLEQVVIERQLTSRSRGDVLRHLARDVSLLRRILGDISKVTASGPLLPAMRDPLGPKSSSQPSLANLTVHLQGDRGLGGRWSAGPVTTAPGAELSFIGSARSESVRLPDRADPRSMQSEIDGALALLARIESKLAVNSRPSEDWLAACRDQEVAEAVDRSLARGRTIELFNEEISEAQSFKGVMAMGGCLLLLMALAVVGLATIVEGLQLPLRDWAVWQWWPAFLLVPVTLFLLLQLLQLAIKREPPAEQPAEEAGN
jgi:hypothetical protein